MISRQIFSLIPPTVGHTTVESSSSSVVGHIVVKHPKVKPPGPSLKKSLHPVKRSIVLDDQSDSESKDANDNAYSNEGVHDESSNDEVSVAGEIRERKESKKRKKRQGKQKSLPKTKKNKTVYETNDYVVFRDDRNIPKFGQVYEMQDGAPFMLVKVFDYVASQKLTFKISDTLEAVSTNCEESVFIIPKSDIRQHRDRNYISIAYCPYDHLEKSVKCEKKVNSSSLIDVDSSPSEIQISYTLESRVRVIQGPDIDETTISLVGKIGIVKDVEDGWLNVLFLDDTDYWLPITLLSIVSDPRIASRSVPFTPSAPSSSSYSEDLVKSRKAKEQQNRKVHIKRDDNCAQRKGNLPTRLKFTFSFISFEYHVGIKSTEQPQRNNSIKGQGHRKSWSTGVDFQNNDRKAEFYHGVYKSMDSGKNKYCAIVHGARRVPGYYGSAVEAAVAYDEYLLRNRDSIKSLKSCMLNFKLEGNTKEIGYLFSEDKDIAEKRNKKNIETSRQIDRWKSLTSIRGLHRPPTESNFSSATCFSHDDRDEIGFHVINTEFKDHYVSMPHCTSNLVCSSPGYIFAENACPISMQDSIRSILLRPDSSISANVEFGHRNLLNFSQSFTTSSSLKIPRKQVLPKRYTE